MLELKPWLGVVLIGAALILAPIVVGSSLGNAWVRVLDFAALYIMLALGLNIVVGFAGLLDLGYIAFYAVGAYLYALLASPHFGLHWPVWAVLPLGALVAGIFGVLLGAPTLRLRGDYLAIVTLGFGEIIRIFLNNLNTPVNITNGPKGIARIDPISLLPSPWARLSAASRAACSPASRNSSRPRASACSNRSWCCAWWCWAAWDTFRA